MKKWLALVAALLVLGVNLNALAHYCGGNPHYGEEPCDCGTDPETGGCLPCEDFDE